MFVNQYTSLYTTIHLLYTNTNTQRSSQHTRYVNQNMALSKEYGTLTMLTLFKCMHTHHTVFLGYLSHVSSVACMLIFLFLIHSV